MRRFSGNGGTVFLSSDPVDFHAEALEDCGDGWDWRMRDPSYRFWDESAEFSFEFYEGGRWQPITAIEIHYPSGRVAFGRCLRGLAVRAFGRCRPLTHLGQTSFWELLVEYKPLDNSSQGRKSQSCELKRGDTKAALYGLGVPPDTHEVVVALPSAGGMFIGAGSVADTGSELAVTFDEKGVQYVLP